MSVSSIHMPLLSASSTEAGKLLPCSFTILLCCLCASSASSSDVVGDGVKRGFRSDGTFPCASSFFLRSSAFCSRRESVACAALAASDSCGGSGLRFETAAEISFVLGVEAAAAPRAVRFFPLASVNSSEEALLLEDEDELLLSLSLELESSEELSLLLSLLSSSFPLLKAPFTGFASSSSLLDSLLLLLEDDEDESSYTAVRVRRVLLRF